MSVPPQDMSCEWLHAIPATGVSQICLSFMCVWPLSCLSFQEMSWNMTCRVVFFVIVFFYIVCHSHGIVFREGSFSAESRQREQLGFRNGWWPEKKNCCSFSQTFKKKTSKRTTFTAQIYPSMLFTRLHCRLEPSAPFCANAAMRSFDIWQVLAG